jgi:transcriptional regulator with XRE-family HTH domain
VVQQSLEFGQELRRRRLAAGITLTRFARMVHYSKGQLSKVERGIKAPSPDLARLCDGALGAGGALVGLVCGQPSRRGSAAGEGGDEGVWLMQLSSDGMSWFQPMSRRQVMAISAASVPAMSIGKPAVTASIDDSTLLGSFRHLFDQYRQLGQATDAGLVLPPLIAQTHVLEAIAKGARSRTRLGFLLLASRYAEYTGWLVQETGDDNGALWWTRRAVELASAGGDQHLAAYALVRQALVALYRENPQETIGLAQRAHMNSAPPRIRGLAAQREAQGHALAGNYDACMRSLERAQVLLARSAPDAAAPVIGTTHLADPTEMVRGWCLHDLGRPRAAAEIIHSQLAQVPQRAQRTRARYGARGALAYAAAGEVDQACHLAEEILDSATTLASSTIRTDLRKLARTLSRYPNSASARELSPALSAPLRAGTQ